jgi:predicted nucleic acid-binding protein
MPDRFSIETKILIYSVDADAGERHEQAMAQLDQLDALAERYCVLTLQALAEFFHAVTRKEKMAVPGARAMPRDWTTLFPTVAADACTLPATIELRADHGFAFWDAMPEQTAKAAGVTRLLTKDMQSGPKVGSL